MHVLGLVMGVWSARAREARSVTEGVHLGDSEYCGFGFPLSSGWTFVVYPGCCEGDLVWWLWFVEC